MITSIQSYNKTSFTQNKIHIKAIKKRNDTVFKVVKKEPHTIQENLDFIDGFLDILLRQRKFRKIKKNIKFK